MNKKQLATAAGTTPDVLNSILDAIALELKKGGTVQLTGFGSFAVKHAEQRIGHNPATGQQMIIPARKRPTFKPSANLKDGLNAPGLGALKVT